MTYRERLAPPWSWWLIGLALAGLGAAEFHGGVGGFSRAVLPYLVLPGGVLLALALMSRATVRVSDGVLHVPGARAPVTAFGVPQALDRRRSRLALGRDGAFYAVRPWLSVTVLLPVQDPGDETPFWLVGTRHPEALVRALEAARAA